MTKIKDLSVIETDWISSQIKFLKHQQSLNKDNDELTWKIAYLESVQFKLKPLEPIVIDSFNQCNMWKKTGDFSIYNQKLQEYLNKEINL
jgi:hypothetical protein